MQTLIYILIVIGTFCFMEFMAWFVHKYVMHGFMWYFHKDHHQPEPGWFEKNDAFFLIFAIPSFLLLLFGYLYSNYYLSSVGLGIMVYGAAYFLVHDIIIHQRFKLFTRTDNVYVRSIRWAHKMHHKHLGKHDGESFGMLIVNKKYWEKVKADLKRKKESIAN
jgi:beta-carotene 3-hydroxylase